MLAHESNISLAKRIMIGFDWMWISLINNLYRHKRERSPKELEIARAKCPNWDKLDVSPTRDDFILLFQGIRLFLKLNILVDSERMWKIMETTIPTTTPHWSTFLINPEILPENIPRDFQHIYDIAKEFSGRAFFEPFLWNAIHYLGVVSSETLDGVASSFITLGYLTRDNVLFNLLGCAICRGNFCKHGRILTQYRENLITAMSIQDLLTRERSVFEATSIFHDDINISLKWGRRPLSEIERDKLYHEYVQVRNTDAHLLDFSNIN